MNAAFLLIPVLLIRYLLLYLLDKEAMKRAAHFPSVVGFEKIALIIYQVATVAIFVCPLFLKVQSGSWLVTGLVVFIAGIVFFAWSSVSFAKAGENGMNTNGMYRFSRNPMYVSYFVYFLGCALLTESWIFFAILMVFQISAHWLILSEERWCMQEFGETYARYMKKVRRYL